MSSDHCDQTAGELPGPVPPHRTQPTALGGEARQRGARQHSHQEQNHDPSLRTSEQKK